MTCGIYKIINEDGMFYIGQSKNIERRWLTHKKGPYSGNRFTYEILMECTVEQLNFWEISWIASERACELGYNKTIGGTDIKVTHPNNETRSKISAKALGNKRSLGYKHTDEHKNKVSMLMKDKVLSEETKEKIALSKRGKSRSEETKRKQSEALKAYWMAKKAQAK
jgi:hypothetical protein